MPARWRGAGFWTCLENSSGSPAGLGASLWVSLKNSSRLLLPVKLKRHGLGRVGCIVRGAGLLDLRANFSVPSNLTSVAAALWELSVPFFLGSFSAPLYPR